MSEVAFLRAVNGVVSFIEPPLSLLLNYPPFNLKLIEYYYSSISALWSSRLSLPMQVGVEIIQESKVLHRLCGQ